MSKGRRGPLEGVQVERPGRGFRAALVKDWGVRVTSEKSTANGQDLWAVVSYMSVNSVGEVENVRDVRAPQYRRRCRSDCTCVVPYAVSLI